MNESSLLSHLAAVVLTAGSLLILPPVSAATYTSSGNGAFHSGATWQGMSAPPSNSNHRFLLSPGHSVVLSSTFNSTHAGVPTSGIGVLSDNSTLSVTAPGRLAYSGTGPLNQTALQFAGSGGALAVAGGLVYAPRIAASATNSTSYIQVEGSGTSPGVLTMWAGGFQYAPLSGGSPATAGGSTYDVLVLNGGLINFGAPNFGVGGVTNLARARFHLTIDGGTFRFTTPAGILANANGETQITLEAGTLDLGGGETYWVQNSGLTNDFLWTGGTLSNVYGISGSSANGRATSKLFLDSLTAAGQVLDINNGRIDGSARTWTVGAISGTATGGTIQFDITSPTTSDSISGSGSGLVIGSGVKIVSAYTGDLLISDTADYVGQSYTLFPGFSSYAGIDASVPLAHWWDGINTFKVSFTNTLKIIGAISIARMEAGQGLEPAMFNTSSTLASTFLPPPAPAPGATVVTINVKTSYGAIGDGVSHPKSSWGSLDPAIQTKLAAAETKVNGSISDPAKKVGANDEADWVAIQAALIEARIRTLANPAQKPIVEIPVGSGSQPEYLINRSLWITSHTTLKWTGTAPTFVRLTGTSVIGSAISNVNSFAGTNYFYPVENIVIENPHLDAGGRGDGSGNGAIPGENGISFANGAQNILITDGIVKHAYWGTAEDEANGFNKQGGRAFQFESGVKNITVRRTRVEDSTIGFSSAFGLHAFGTAANPIPYTPLRAYELAYNIAWGIRYEDVEVHETDLPFFFANLLFGFNGNVEYDAVNNHQLVVVDGAVVTDSGYLRRNFNKDLDGPPTPATESAIVGLLGAKNVTLRNISVVNNPSYPRIGAAIRGFATNLHVRDFDFDASAEYYFDLSSNLLSTALPNPRSADFSITGFTSSGTSLYGLAARVNSGSSPARLRNGHIQASYGAWSGGGGFLHGATLNVLNLANQETITIEASPAPGFSGPTYEDTLDQLLP